MAHEYSLEGWLELGGVYPGHLFSFYLSGSDRSVRSETQGLLVCSQIKLHNGINSRLTKPSSPPFTNTGTPCPARQSLFRAIMH